MLVQEIITHREREREASSHTMASEKESSIASTSKKLLTTFASLAATAVLIRSITNELLPYEVRDSIFSTLGGIWSRFTAQLTLVVQETEGFVPNQIYHASKTYLATKIPPSTSRIRVSKQEEEKSIAVSVEHGEEIVDVFQGIQFRWQLICRETRSQDSRSHYDNPTTTELRSFELSFDKKHKNTALGPYFNYILEQAKAIEAEDKILKLHMNNGDYWSPINLHHPATFETLAMDSELKRTVMEDLTRFVKRKEYYKKIGKAWKRGYLLYGPPGTGKSSLIAAMANFLKFDIYDLELTQVSCNSSLRELLIGTANRSIVVIEDIDCSKDLQNREQVKGSQDNHSPTEEKVTLSGLLNFVDGLWSSCGEERIIVFTTNYKDQIDPALLRPGRMDMHIHMGYCGPCAFRVLVSNYHAIDQHYLLGEIEELIQEVEITPAEVAEELMRSDDADVALQGLTDFLRRRKTDVDEGKLGRES